ncbi:MAG: rhamnulokinase family protein, partial [Anaerolineae bacterium]|nr:rhamnulokinase family protein [Anaerolineae bacterium]
MRTKNFLAIDLGAESGRAVVGKFDGETLTLEEVHRFSNGPVRLLDSLYWNTLALFTEIKNGLAKTINGAAIELASLGLDTWGVDFGLLDRSGAMLGNPRHYRDSRTEGMVEKACSIVPRAEIFGQTGIQFLPLNTLTQLLAMVEQRDPTLEIADTLLTMPDLFNYWLTGQKVSEYTNASTTQCLNMATGQWATGLLEKLGIPTHILPEVIAPGSRLGTLLPHIAAEVGLTTDLDVIAPATHDTGSAVAAIPVAGATKGNYAYISSGTWSLVGQETPAPIINEKSLAYNFTNEGGVQDTIRLLKNVGGLWLVQESRRTWARQGRKYSYSDLSEMAETADPFVALIDPDDPLFGPPGDMPARIQTFCQRTGQAAPQSEGEFVRCALESLALRYRWVINRAAELSGQPVEVVHIVGGGSQNRLLNQFTANATGRPVVAGPIEATAIGNVLMQMLALGQISSLSEGRDLVRRSFPVETYEPQDGAAWEEAYQRYLGEIQ